MKITLITPTSNQVMTFRKALIERLQSENFKVSVITFDDEYRKEIEAKNVKLYHVDGSNRSKNLFKNFELKNKYTKLLRQIQPDIVFTFMLKPNIYGVRAAKKAGVKKIFSMVEGAGDVFINNSLKWKIIRAYVCRLYRKSFKHSQKVFFLNNSDKAEFIERKLVRPEQCIVIPGIGVDLEHFAYKPLKNNRTFLMIARMLKTKGVMEYCSAARIVKQKYPDAIFNYLGGEGTVKIADIQEFIDDGSINYLGTTADVRPYLEDCSAFVLPSYYREGLPMSIMEAEAVGRGIITTNNIGCIDTVNEQFNGYLVNIKDAENLSEKILWLLNHPQKTKQIGINARKFAEENFDKDKINAKILSCILWERI